MIDAYGLARRQIARHAFSVPRNALRFSSLFCFQFIGSRVKENRGSKRMEGQRGQRVKEVQESRGSKRIERLRGSR
eukprot:1618485-Rhodomonas_salina.1